MKISLLILASLLTFNSFAQDFVCKEAYEKKISKLTKFGKNAQSYGSKAFVVGYLTEALAFNTTIVSGSLIISTPVSIVAFVAGIGWLGYQSNKVEAHVTAKAIIEESFTDQEAVMEQNAAAYLKYQNDILSDKLARANEKRTRKGKAELSREEYLKIHPIKDWQAESFKTPIMVLTNSINRTRASAVTYRQVAELIKSLSQDETFCPNGKVLGKRKLQKVLEAKLSG